MRLIDADKINFRDGLSPELSRDKICMIPLRYAEITINTAPTINADDYFDAADRIKPCPNCRYLHLYKLLSPNTPWKSMQDETPKKHGNYIVYTNKGNVYISTWNTLLKRWSGRMRNAVTHWMHLPAGPEEARNHE